MIQFVKKKQPIPMYDSCLQSAHTQQSWKSLLQSIKQNKFQNHNRIKEELSFIFSCIAKWLALTLIIGVYLVLFACYESYFLQIKKKIRLLYNLPAIKCTNY